MYQGNNPYGSVLFILLLISLSEVDFLSLYLSLFPPLFKNIPFLSNFLGKLMQS